MKTETTLTDGFYWIKERGKLTVAEYDAAKDEWWMIGYDHYSKSVDEVIEKISPASAEFSILNPHKTSRL